MNFKLFMECIIFVIGPLVLVCVWEVCTLTDSEAVFIKRRDLAHVVTPSWQAVHGDPCVSPLGHDATYRWKWWYASERLPDRLLLSFSTTVGWCYVWGRKGGFSRASIITHAADLLLVILSFSEDIQYVEACKGKRVLFFHSEVFFDLSLEVKCLRFEVEELLWKFSVRTGSWSTYFSHWSRQQYSISVLAV